MIFYYYKFPLCCILFFYYSHGLKTCHFIQVLRMTYSLMLHPHKIVQTFFMGTQREKNYGFGGGVLWVRLWEMKFLQILVLP
jgi:hypothetical protein